MWSLSPLFFLLLFHYINIFLIRLFLLFTINIFFFCLFIRHYKNILNFFFCFSIFKNRFFFKLIFLIILSYRWLNFGIFIMIEFTLEFIFSLCLIFYSISTSIWIIVSFHFSIWSCLIIFMRILRDSIICLTYFYTLGNTNFINLRLLIILNLTLFLSLIFHFI